MVEPEVAFNDITDNMDLAEDFIKYCVQWALDNCADDVKFLNDMFDKGLIERLQGVLKESFVRLPYTEGIKILEEAVAKGHKFEFPVYWGVDLASEHERYLVEDHFKCPVILTDYPKEIKDVLYEAERRRQDRACHGCTLPEDWGNHWRFRT